MSYSTTNPPVCMIPRIGGGRALWSYLSADVHTDVDASGYFTNGGALGMKVGDAVIVCDTGNSYGTTLHSVTAVTSGAATVSSAVLS